jgi:C_GCAxxG_C_C family probable redox protein
MGDADRMRDEDRAEALMHEGFNCAQSVLATCGPALGLDRETCLRLAAPFGGGLSRAGETCGALTGGLMALGLVRGVPSPLPQDKEQGYAAGRALVERFRTAHGSLTCRVLCGVDLSTPAGLQEFRDRGIHDNLCPRYVRNVVAMVGEMLEGGVP